MKFQVGGIGFPSKRAIGEHVRSILERAPLGDLLSGDDFAFVRDLINRHPHAAQKIGPGVRAIRVDLNSQWAPCKMLTLIRSDGSETDVSYRICLYPPSPRQDVAEACREAVVGDIIEFKQKAFDSQSDANGAVACPLTNQAVGWRAAHVDHSPPWTFRAIVDAFLEAEGLSPAEIELRGSEDGEVQRSFADADLRVRFRMFHNQRAHLRIVAKEANLALARPGNRDCKDAA